LTSRQSCAWAGRGAIAFPFLDLAAKLRMVGLRRDGYGVRRALPRSSAEFPAPGDPVAPAA